MPILKWAGAALGLGLALLLVGAGAAHADTFLGLYSEAGDPVGGGRRRVLDETNGTLSIQHRWGRVDVTFVETGGRTWRLRFIAPAGFDLLPGLYPDAERAGIEPGPRPGLVVESTVRGCQRAAGRFSVVNARYGPDGAPLEFAATFEQRCDGATAALFGTISFASGLPAPPTQTPTPTMSPQQTFIQLDRAAGGPFGELHRTLTLADGTITAQHSPGFLSIVFNGGSDYRALSFEAPEGQELVPGVYGNARRWPFQPPIWPGLDAGGGCNQLRGSFAILEADYGPDGSVRRLALNFEQYCEGVGPPLVGVVRFLSDVPAAAPTPTAPTATPTPMVYDTYVELLSEAGDYVGLGQALTLVPSDGLFTAQYADGHLAIDFDGDDHWSFDFAAPAGRALGPGHYTDVTRYPFHSPARGGLDVGGQGRGCNMLIGDFVVFEAAFDDDGSIERFAANFEQHCEHGTPALFGIVRYRSSVPAGASTPTPAPPTPTPPRPPSLLQIHSQQNEYIGRGRSYLFTEDDGTFAATIEAGALVVDYQGAEEDWTINLAPPLGETLEARPYELAQRWPFQAPRRPGVNVSVTGRRCNRIGGRFDILELEVSPSGDVRRLAADIDQRCELSPPALYASIRINSDIPVRPAPAATPTPDPATTYLTISGRTITTAAGSFFATTAGRRVVHVSFNGAAGSRDLFWNLTFAAPECTALGPGAYEGAERYPFQPVGLPGFEIGGNGSGCNELNGRFDILELVTGPDDEVLRFAADFESTCFGSGSVRYVAPLPTPAATPTAPPITHADYAHMWSDREDYIGECEERELTTADGYFNATHDGNSVQVQYVGNSVWFFSFAAPDGAPLVPGVYEDARRTAFRGINPGLDISGEGRGCGRVTGRFVILEAVLGAGDEVEHFAAEFEQHCEGGEPALLGLIRYRSTLDAPTPVPSGAPTRTPARLPCVGDCDHDGQIRISDLIAGVAVAIGSTPLDTCPDSDGDRDGQVTINDLIVAVTRALNGCVAR